MKTKTTAVLTAILFAVLGCEPNEKKGADSAIPQKKDLRGENIVLASINDISSFVDAEKTVSECSHEGLKISCTASSGKIDEYRGYEFPGSESTDGDFLRFSILGPLRENHKIVVLKAELGHDAPFLLFWNKDSGGHIYSSPYYDNIIFSKDATTLMISEGVSTSFKKWKLWIDLQGQARKYDCETDSADILVDSAIWLVKKQHKNAPLRPQELIGRENIACKQARHQYDSSLPDFLSFKTIN
jgi:hypothetical protein